MTARARPSRTTKTKDGDNWKAKPSALACGACHDGINFATGAGITLKDKAAGLTQSNVNGTGLAHAGGAQPNDWRMRALPQLEQHRSLAHLPVTPPNPGNALVVAGGNANTNSAWIASGSSVGRIPAGAIVPTYEVQSVSRNASKQPVMVFRWLQNGTPVPINPFATAAVNPATGQKEMWDNFMGSPSAQFVFAVPQDGIAAPADFNGSGSGYLRKIWDGSATGTGAGTLTGPDASGFYTVTLTGVTIPDNAVMLTGGMGYSYNATSTQPQTQTNLADVPGDRPGGRADEQGGRPDRDRAQRPEGRHRLHRPARDRRGQALQRLPPGARHVHPGCVPRGPAQRRDDLLVVPQPEQDQQRLGGGFDSASSTPSTRRPSARCPYNWHAVSSTEGFFNVTFPGILNDCQTCHLPGTFDFSATPAQALSSRLLRTVGTGTYSASVSLSPYVAVGTNYGSGFSFDANGVPTDAAPTTLVLSPTVSACSACHDSPDAITHMKGNTGSFYAPRSAAVGVSRDVPGLPRHRQDGGHRGRALEEPLSTSASQGCGGKKTSAPARQAAGPVGTQEDRDAAELDGDDGSGGDRSACHRSTDPVGWSDAGRRSRHPADGPALHRSQQREPQGVDDAARHRRRGQQAGSLRTGPTSRRRIWSPRTCFRSVRSCRSSISSSPCRRLWRKGRR